MKSTLRSHIALMLILQLFMNCDAPTKLYKSENPDKIYNGTLDHATHTALRQYLESRTGAPPKDTIIIKYEYNKETCWELLDRENDQHIMGFVTMHKQRMQKRKAARPEVSFFDFREPGRNFNMIKKWNDDILIDSTRQLMKLVFNERCICGNSIIVLPDRKFVFIRSDAHEMAMDLTQEQIRALLEHTGRPTKLKD